MYSSAYSNKNEQDKQEVVQYFKEKARKKAEAHAAELQKLKVTMGSA